MSEHEDLARATKALLEPLAALLLRQGVPHRAFSDWAKEAFVAVARRQGPRPGRDASASQISVRTGLTRKDVRRILEQPADGGGDATQRYHRAARVIAGWRRAGPYSDGPGKPRRLSLGGAHASFQTLVRDHAGDVPASTVLKELDRVGAIRIDDEDHVELLVDAFVPHRVPAEQLAVLGQDVGALIATIGHNLAAPAEHTRLQRKVFYDNLPLEALPALRALAAEEGQALLERLDAALAAQDRDTAPQVQGTGRAAAGLGVFWMESVPDEGTSEIDHA